MITLDTVQKMFASMRRDAPWYIEGDLLWAYFFTDRDQQRLSALARRLSPEGYRTVSIYLTEDGSSSVLHLQRIETHTPQSLHARNQELHHLATECGIASYDGMDVGPVPSKQSRL
ncbi:ribonuclease E inhibitor RraB [Prosthecobacter sp.]|uniref:ribonuclease E inhibitor RraB n=1 Tax=Prosthecobacter sp. TaxID=1965333 RepID=UPI003783A97B